MCQPSYSIWILSNLSNTIIGDNKNSSPPKAGLSVALSVSPAEKRNRTRYPSSPDGHFLYSSEEESLHRNDSFVPRLIPLRHFPLQ